VRLSSGGDGGAYLSGRGGQRRQDADGGCCHIHKTRHRASLREARTKAQAEQAEANKRRECFGAAYGSAQRQTQRLSEFIDKTYMTWAKTNKKSWRDDELI